MWHGPETEAVSDDVLVHFDYTVFIRDGINRMPTVGMEHLEPLPDRNTVRSRNAVVVPGKLYQCPAVIRRAAACVPERAAVADYQKRAQAGLHECFTTLRETDPLRF